MTNFSQAIQDLTNKTENSLSRRANVGELYDAYGVDYADAGSLESFKARLLETHMAREITLCRNDLPYADKSRDAVVWQGHEFHAVRKTA